MRILITGISGFIGQNLLPILLQPQEHELFCVTRSPCSSQTRTVEWITADLADAAWTHSLPQMDFDAVIHLAQSKHHRNFPEKSQDIFDINVRATVQLADWAYTRGVKKFIFASTGNVYGSNSEASHEADACLPNSMYGASKLSAETLLKPFAQFYDISVLRFFGVYGPLQKDALIPTIVQSILLEQEVVLAGNIGVRFNPIYIDDCVRAVVAFLRRRQPSSYEIFNVGGSEVVDLKQLASLLAKLLGKTARLTVNSDPYKSLIGSTEKLVTQTQFRCGVSLEDGMRQTVSSLLPITNP